VREEEVSQQQFQQSEVLLFGVVVDKNEVNYLLGSFEGDHIDQTGKVTKYSRIDILRVDYHEKKRKKEQQIQVAVRRFRIIFGNLLNFVNLDAVNHLADHKITYNSDGDTHQKHILQHNYPLIVGNIIPKLLKKHLKRGKKLYKDNRQQCSKVQCSFDIVADFKSLCIVLAVALGVVNIGFGNKPA
jgi:hypothetical protein